MKRELFDIPSEDRIEEVAKAIFNKKGFEATSMSDIAEEVQIDLSYLYYKYNNKKIVYDAIMYKNIKAFIDELCVLINVKELLFDEKLEMIVLKFTAFIVENNDISLFILEEFSNRKFKYTEKLMGDLSNKKRSSVFLMSLAILFIFPYISKQFSEKSNKNFEDKFNQELENYENIVPIVANALRATCLK